MHARRLHDIVSLPGVLHRVPRAGRFGAVHTARRSAAPVFHDSCDARHPRGGSVAIGDRHAVARPESAISPAHANRPVDPSDLVVCLGDGSPRLRPALPAHLAAVARARNSSNPLNLLNPVTAIYTCVMRAPLLAALLLLALAGNAAAQVGRVTGTVKDERGDPIRGATIIAENPDASPSSFTASTDDK